MRLQTSNSGYSDMKDVGRDGARRGTGCVNYVTAAHRVGRDRVTVWGVIDEREPHARGTVEQTSHKAPSRTDH